MKYAYSTDEEDLKDVLAGKFVAFDTEFGGVDFKTETCPFRSKCHVFSVASVPYNAEFNPRGYYEPTAVVMPRRFLPMLDSVPLYAHNAGVDVHTALNYTPETVLNVTDTLSMARLLYPGLALKGGFGLDNLGQRMLGMGKTTSFKELVQRPRLVQKVRKGTPSCACGADKCRRRGPSHVKVPGTDRMEWVQKGMEETPLDEIRPGHAKWDALVEYSAADAYITSAIVQIMLNRVENL